MKLSTFKTKSALDNTRCYESATACRITCTKSMSLNFDYYLHFCEIVVHKSPPLQTIEEVISFTFYCKHLILFGCLKSLENYACESAQEKSITNYNHLVNSFGTPVKLLVITNI